VPATATVPLVRSGGTTNANTAPTRADRTRWTSTPTVGLAVPASPCTMVAIIASGMSALPPVLCANHMVTPANTAPASTHPLRRVGAGQPSAPRSH